MKYLLLPILLIGLKITCVQSQNLNRENTVQGRDTSKVSKGPFYLPGFEIDPLTKTVSRRGIGGKGDVGEEVIYTIDARIKYDSTALVIVGQHMLFKEYFPKSLNLDHIKVLFSNKYVSIFTCEDSLYTCTEFDVSKGVNIAGYKIVDNSYFVNKAGDVYFLGLNRLEKITKVPKLDIATLRYLSRQYCSDKNGLYFIDSHNDKNYVMVNQAVVVEASDGKEIIPTVASNYINYNKHIYASDKILRLDIDVANMHEVVWGDNYGSYLFDRKNLYERQTYGYAAELCNPNVPTLKFFSEQNIRLLSIFPSSMNFIAQKDTNELYLPLGKDKYIYGSDVYKQGVLVNTSDGYYFLDRWLLTVTPQKIKKIFVNNVDTRRKEDFDINQFRYLSDHFFTYKNHAFYEYMPFMDTLDTKKLVFLSDKNLVSNFMTDGRTLINTNIMGYSSSRNKEIEFVSFFDTTLKNINLSNIRIVNKDVLVDDKNIYYRGNIIPMNKLGMKVKVFLQ